MRQLLEDLPGALLPDPTHQSDDPGVERQRLDDDLVRPVAEEDLPVDAGRSRRSPLARHIELQVAPFEPALPTGIGLRLAVEGSRLRSAQLLVGHRHQGIERRATGLPITGPALPALLSVVSPAAVTQLAVVVALEQLLDVVVDEDTLRWRGLVLDLAAIKDAADVVHQTLRRRPRDAAAARRLQRATESALATLVGGDLPRFACLLGVNIAISAEERATLGRRLDDVEAAFHQVPVERVIDHLQQVGVLDLRRARDFGLCGPVLRAAGGLDDLPLELGDALPSEEHAHYDGSAGARLRRRVEDARHLLARAQRLVRSELPSPPPPPPLDDRLTRLTGAADAAVRAPAGTLSVYVVVDNGTIRRLRLRPPELPLLAAIPRTLAGVRLDDVADVLATFGLAATAMDR